MMECKICSHEANFIFSKTVLLKYDVKYYKCSNCFFLQTENPYWLDESYESAITSLDIGLVYRNLLLTPVVQTLISRYFDGSKPCLDFGGGYGLLVRIMRDRGFNFYRLDKYCENLFARHFDIQDLPLKSRFEVVTAFELFEHLADPIAGIEEILSFGDTIIFSTDLSPNDNLSSWEYLVPEVGQHVSLYHYKSLVELSKRFKLNFYSNGVNIHMFSPKKISAAEFRFFVNPRISKMYNRTFSRRPSLLPVDYNFLKAVIIKNIKTTK